MLRFSDSKLLALVKSSSDKNQRAWQKPVDEPPTSFEGLNADRTPVIIQITGCKCNDVVYQDSKEMTDLLADEFDNVFPKDTELLKEPIERIVKSVAHKYAKQRKCHATMHYFMCYCDEHEH